MYWGCRSCVGPGDHAIVTVPNYQSMETLTLRHGRRGRAAGCCARENGWALGPRRARARCCGRDTGSSRSTSRTTRRARSRTATTFVALVGAVRRARDRALQRRGLPRPRARPGADAPAGVPTCRERAISLNVMSKAYGLPGLRVGWLAYPRPRPARAARAAQALHVDLQCRAERVIWPRSRSAMASRSAPATARSSTPTCRSSTLSSPAGTTCSTWQHPEGGCVCFPRYLGGDVEAFCRELLEAAGVVLLPADIYASDVGAVPADRFRIGVGRRDPEPALAAFEAFLKEEWTAALVRRDGPEVAKGRRVSGRECWTARGPYLLGGGQPPCSPYIRLAGTRSHQPRG